MEFAHKIPKVLLIHIKKNINNGLENVYNPPYLNKRRTFDRFHFLKVFFLYNSYQSHNFCII